MSVQYCLCLPPKPTKVAGGFRCANCGDSIPGDPGAFVIHRLAERKFLANNRELRREVADLKLDLAKAKAAALIERESTQNGAAPKETAPYTTKEVAHKFKRGTNWVKANARSLGGFKLSDAPNAPWLLPRDYIDHLLRMGSFSDE